MTHYERISSASFDEKNITVVFDFGYIYTKVGFAGEFSPRSIIKSEVKSRISGQMVKVFDFKTEKQLKDQITDFIHFLYFRKLLANPKDRGVVVVENVLGLSLKKNILADVFFKHFNVSAVCFTPSHLVSMMTLACDTCVVVDIGYEEATIVPIFEGIPILDAWQAVPCASKLIHSSLRELLLEHGNCVNSSGVKKEMASVENLLTDDVLEDIKVRCCLVSTLERKIKLLQKVNDQSVELPTLQPITYHLAENLLLTIPGNVRELATEVLFENDEDNLNLATAVLYSILKCPIDARKALASNLFIIGGTASMKGLKHRLLAEIRHLSGIPPFNDRSKLDIFKVHLAPVKDNIVSWLGGSVLGFAETIFTRSVSRAEYLNSGCVPDWSDQTLFTREDRHPSYRSVA